MIWWLLGLALLLVIIIAIISSSIHIRVHYTRQRDNDNLIFDLRALFGIYRHRYKIPIVQFSEASKGLVLQTEQVNVKTNEKTSAKKEKITYERVVEFYKNAKLLVANAFHFTDWLRHTLKRVRCVKFRWCTEIGVDDAAQTGLLTGVVWGVKTSILGLIFNRITMDAKPQIAVNPQYNHPQFTTDLFAEAKISVFFALSAGIQLLWRIWKIKGGLRTWRNYMMKRQAATRSNGQTE